MTGPDTETCPRCKRKGLRAERIPGAATDPRDPNPSAVHYWCSNCQHYWHPFELLRPRARFTG